MAKSDFEQDRNAFEAYLIRLSNAELSELSRTPETLQAKVNKLFETSAENVSLSQADEDFLHSVGMKGF